MPLLLVTLSCLASCQPKNAALRALTTDLIDVGTETQLFVDDWAIQQTQAVARQIHPLIKHRGNPILRPDRVWEGNYAMPETVLYDESERVFKMWYRCLGVPEDARSSGAQFCYSVSDDGIDWKKPELGLVDYWGSRKNNLIKGPFGEVIKDLREGEGSRRFKSLGDCGSDPKSPAGLCLSASPDGLHWNSYPENPLFGDLAAESSGTHKGIGARHGAFGWDDTIGKYVAFISPSAVFRTIGRSVSDDFIHWSLPSPILVASDEYPAGSQFYRLSVFKDRSIYFGLLSVYHPNSRMVDVELTYSRDAIAWRHVKKGHAVLTYGLPDSFDSHAVYALKPLVTLDKIWVYYSAYNGSYALASFEAQLPASPNSIRDLPQLKGRRGYGGLAISLRDRFVSLEAGSAKAEVITKPFHLKGRRLYLNADSTDGEIRVELLDMSGEPLTGFRETDSDPIREDLPRSVVSWRGQSDLSSLRDLRVRIRFLMNNCRLFSFTFAE